MALSSRARVPSRSVSCRATTTTSPPSLLDRLSALFTPPQQQKKTAPFRPTPAAADAAAQIAALAAATDKGTATTPQARRDILALGEVLRAEAPLCRGSVEEAKKLISGTWRQQFATEKETLFIFSTIAPLFGVKGEAALQVIDAEAGRLQNVITFSNGAAFVVDSTLEVEEREREAGEQEEGAGGPLPLRCSFRFTSAALKLPGGKEIKLPPAGKGWFDNLYVDEGTRVAFDIRKDWLVVERDGPVRWY